MEDKKYYAQYDKRNGNLYKAEIQCLADFIENIEISESIFNNFDKYIYSNGNIILNPNYDTEQLIKAKENKYAENNLKAKSARYNQEFTIIVQEQECVFDTNEETQRDLLTAFDVCSTGTTYDGWVTNNGVELDLTMEDVVLIFQTFKEKSSVYQLWKTFKTAIDNANTIKQVEAIVINYEVL